MATWRNGLQDLRALGITVSTAQQDVITNGGEALVVQGFPAPGGPLVANPLPALDQNNGLVLVSAVVASFPIDRRPPQDLSVPFYEVKTMADLLDLERSEHWSFWPSYTGIQMEVEDSFWQLEELVVARVWSGVPTAYIGRSVADRIALACSARINASLYREVDNMSYLAAYKELPRDELAESPHDRRILKTMQHLIQAGLWDPTRNKYTGIPLEYPPMEQILEGDPSALRAWRNLVAQSRTGASRARRIVPQSSLATYNSKEKEFEPWL